MGKKGYKLVQQQFSFASSRMLRALGALALETVCFYGMVLTAVIITQNLNAP